MAGKKKKANVDKTALTTEDVTAILTGFHLFRTNEKAKNDHWGNIGKDKKPAADAFWAQEMAAYEAMTAAKAQAKADAEAAADVSSRDSSVDAEGARDSSKDQDEVGGVDDGQTTSAQELGDTKSTSKGKGKENIRRDVLGQDEKDLKGGGKKMDQNGQAALRAVAAPASPSTLPTVTTSTSAGPSNDTGPSTDTGSSTTNAGPVQPPGMPATTGGSTSITSALSALSICTTPQANRVVQLKSEVLELNMTPRTRPPKSDEARNVLAATTPDVSAGMISRLANLQSHGTALQYPIRSTFGTGKEKVVNNHFHSAVGTNLPLYQYKITPTLSGKSKRKIRLIIETAIDQCAFLNNNKASFATNYFGTIVSWVKLHEPTLLKSHTQLFGNGNDPRSRWYLVSVQDGPATHSLELSYGGLVDVQGLLNHKDLNLAHANDNLQPTLRALNILVLKSFDEEPVKTLQMGANEFFIKSAHRDLGNGHSNSPRFSDSLCMLRGYSYTVKPGVEHVLLNLNAATSAFWKPVRLSDVFQDKFTFQGWDWEAYTRALRGIRVYITYERGDPDDEETYKRINTDQARVKPIESLGCAFEEEPFEMGDAKKETNVLRHFSDSEYCIIRIPVLVLANPDSIREENQIPETLGSQPWDPS